MTDAPTPETRDYRDTVFLPKTDFPMKAGLPQKEPGILARWQGMDLYRRLRDARQGREKFILHDGPPYANGDMHIGHALNHILKDMVVRTQSLLGKDAPYVPGWDCHGLPIEWKVEEEYRKKKRNKDEVPVEEFRAECRAYARQWVDRQREQLKRLGINGDWDNPYLTMDFDAEATIVGELLKFAENGQLYRGAKPVMWSPVEKTALAEAEIEYEDITSTQIDVAFEIVDAPNEPDLVGAHAVIWTTTPWTIPVNQALAYGPEVEYVLVEYIEPKLVKTSEPGEPRTDANFEKRTKRLIVAKSLVSALEGRLTNEFARRYGIQIPVSLKHVRAITSKDLEGAEARHPMAKFFSSPLPFRGGDGGGEPGTSEQLGSPHPNPVGANGPSGGRASSPTPKEEGLSSVHRDSPFAEFFLRPRPFLPGDFVTTESGTGLVHMAPDHGEDDFDLCKANGIEPVFAVEGDGRYRADWAWLGGEGSVINPKFNAPDGPICTALREAGGLLAASADYKHSYPHSWRSKAKVIYRCTPQWFVPMDKAIDPSTTSFAAGGPPPPVGEVREATTPPRHGEGDQPKAGGGATLREKAMAAIEETRWFPEKGQKRIRSMVEGRPDWVLSRQRAWGVPITLFVNRKTGQYLNDPAVNARIVAGVRAQGVDAWSESRAQEYLGADYRAEDYERVADILDVWFDSGSTHAFVLESGKWPDVTRPKDHVGPWADLYLEGSDQHRGWFQSSLLESCGTRGHAPYKAVLTHGFTMDQKGMKMSKSLGNTIDPLKVMESYGADIIRLWALSVDFTEDHRIGDEILKGVADQYRKLRNSFRYLLGALDGFTEAERSAKVEMPDLEKYILYKLFHLEVSLQNAIDEYDFNSYVRDLIDFCNEDLSALFFDVRKDRLYCDDPKSPQRIAYRQVLDILFEHLIRYAAPVIVFTAEEVWQSRYPDRESIHLEKIIPTPQEWQDTEVSNKMQPLLVARGDILEAIEPLRRQKVLGSSLQASVIYPLAARAKEMHSHKPIDAEELAELAIVASVTEGPKLEITPTSDPKCGRCWRHLPEVAEDGALCGRCEDVVNG